MELAIKCYSHITYFDKKKKHIFIANFKNDEFTGEIYYCLIFHPNDKEYGQLIKKDNEKLYEHIKRLALKDYYDIREITKEEASKIIETFEPIGKFILEDNGVFVGIDNSTGDCWVEEFDDFHLCVDWIRGKFEIIDFEQ